jgi:hypothetical protein
MSRTKKGRKRPNTELWSKRASKAGVVGWGPSKDAKVITHRMERIEGKQVIEEQKDELVQVDKATYLHVIDPEC